MRKLFIDLLTSGGSDFTPIPPELGDLFIIANFPIPASAVVESEPYQSPLGATHAEGDQAMASLLLVHGVDGSSYATAATASGAPAAILDIPETATLGYFKARMTNGAVAQGGFAMSVAVAV